MLVLLLYLVAFFPAPADVGVAAAIAAAVVIDFADVELRRCHSCWSCYSILLLLTVE